MSSRTASSERRTAPRIRIEVLKGARFDARSGNEGIDLMLLEPDDSAELIRGDVAFVDELVKGAKRHTKTLRSVGGAQPADLRGCHVTKIPHGAQDVRSCHIKGFKYFSLTFAIFLVKPHVS